MRICCSLLVLLFCCVSPAAEPLETPNQSAAAELNQAELDKQFESMLSGATLVGKFTVTGEKKTGEPKEERYTLEKVSKIQGSLWLFQARIQYGDHDVTLPMPLTVLWAGETPVITLNKLPLPGLGTFSARVLFHEGKYSGTWSGGDHGGHLFGKVVKAEQKAESGERKAEN